MTEKMFRAEEVLQVKVSAASPTRGQPLTGSIRKLTIEGYTGGN